MMTLLSTAYLAPIAYYVQLMHAPKVIIEAHENYNKQSFRNRTFIGTDQGPLALSIPVVKGYEIKSPIREVKLSDHGEWRHQHLFALASNYGNTPFYEHYIDDLKEIICHPFTYLFDLNEALQSHICEQIGISPRLSFSTDYIEVPTDTPASEIRDLRNTLHPKKDIATEVPDFIVCPYYQVFSNKQPFMPNLSIVDLLFNMGPESILVLQKSIASTQTATRQA